MGKFRPFVLVGIVAVTAFLIFQGQPKPISAAQGPSSQIKNVWVLMVENTDWSTVKNSTSMPYVHNTLLPNYAHTEKMYSQNHPSLPNYVTLEAGNNLGLTDGAFLPTTHNSASTDHLTTYLNKAGYNWKYYAENLPGNGTTCNTSDPGFPYSEDHNPFVYFNDVRNNTSYCIAHERPYSELSTDLSSGNVPSYSFIVPSDPDQGEKCADGTKNCTVSQKLAQADGFLSREVPKIQASAAYKAGGLILVLWDEAAGTSNPNTTPSGLIAVSPFAKKNYASNITYNEGSIIRTTEEIFGLSPKIDKASSAADLSDLLTVSLNGGTGSTPTPGSPTPKAGTPTPTRTPGTFNSADINHDGKVDVLDLSILLKNWTG